MHQIAMFVHSITLETHTQHERHQAINECQALVDPFGYIDHFHFDGIGQVTLTITMDNHRFKALLEAIQESGWLHLDKYFDEFGLADNPQPKEIPVHMTIQLVKQLKDRDF